MAQKKRGLGRGLQALIPEAQTEIPSRRPTDVFFPESRSPARAKTTADEASDAASRHAAEIASTLLAPSKRTRGRRSSPPATATKPSAAAAKPKSGRARSGSESTGRSEGTRTGRRRSRVSRETGAHVKKIYVREPRQTLLVSSSPQFALARRSQMPLGR